MKLGNLRLVHAVKLGSKEFTFISANDKISIELLDNNLIKISNEKDIVYTSLYNVPWFKPFEENYVERPIKKAPVRKTKAGKNKKD